MSTSWTCVAKWIEWFTKNLWLELLLKFSATFTSIKCARGVYRDWLPCEIVHTPLWDVVQIKGFTKTILLKKNI